jgi:hypothetical protein
LLNKEQEDEDPIAIGCDPNNSVGASARDDAIKNRSWYQKCISYLCFAQLIL